MKKTPPLILTVSHNIFLSREERYMLAIENTPIEVVGVSLPAWFSLKQESNPAEEVFCKYSLYNNPHEHGGTIDLIDGGYRINLPQLPKDWVSPELSDEEWRGMSEKELSVWYKKHPIPKSAKHLLDTTDGGSEYLKFKYLREMDIEGHKLQIAHYCVIKTTEQLLETIA